MAAVFLEDVEEFATQTRLPGLYQTFGVHHQPAGLPVLVAGHHVLRPWKTETGGARHVRFQVLTRSANLQKTAHQSPRSSTASCYSAGFFVFLLNLKALLDLPHVRREASSQGDTDVAAL